MKNKGKRRQPRGAKSLVGKTIDLDISDMAYGGQALGKYRGKTVFVPYTLPGETITAEITEERGGAAFARGLRLRAASADRVAARCPHFGPGRCWGCQWQHIDYSAQLLLKRDVLADQLARVGKLPDRIIDQVMRPVLPAAKIWHYNQRLTLRRGERGGWGLRRQGKTRHRSHQRLLTLLTPELIAILSELDIEYERARRLTLQRGSDGQIMLIFEIDEEEAPRLHTDLPISVNLILPDKAPINLIGAAQSHFRIKDRAFRVTAGAAIRPNIDQTALHWWTKYCTRCNSRAIIVSSTSMRVWAFSAPSSRNKRRWLPRSRVIRRRPAMPRSIWLTFDQVDIVEGQVEAVLSDMVEAAAEYDMALVDPPSGGLSRSVIADLARLPIERLVYVSGDPPSLARDCKSLHEAGFRLREVQAVDMAPQTYFITAVARFER